MKKFAFILVLLMLAGCQPEKPEVPALQSSVDAAVTPSPDTSSGTQTGKEASEPSSITETVLLPENLPELTGDAALLPEEPFVILKAGYTAGLLTPAQYNARIVADRHWPKGFPGSDFFWLAQDGKCALVNLYGKIVTDFIYDDPESNWQLVNEEAGAALAFRDGKYGLLSAFDGQELLPFEYEKIWGEKGYIFAQKKEDRETMVLDAQMKTRYAMSRGEELLIVRDTDILLQNSMLRFYDHDTGAPLTNFACERASVLTGSKADDEFVRIGVTIGEKEGMCDELGAWIARPMYTHIGAFRGDYATFEKDGKFGVLNYQGEVVVQAVWDDLVLFDNGASICRDNKWGTITDLESGEIALQPFYDYIDGFDEDGRACFEKNGKYGLLDREGNVLVAAKYKQPLITEGLNLEEGYYAVKGEEGANTMGIVGRGGIYSLSPDHAFFPQGLNQYYSDDEAYNLVRTPTDKWGYVDGTGKFVIDAKFEMIDGFVDGWEAAFVKLDGKVCLIGRDGNIAVQTVFDDVVALNPKTKVCAMAYTEASGDTKVCLVRLETPA